MKKLPELAYVSNYDDPNCDNGETLGAYRALANAPDGKVGVYKLVETIDKRQVAEVRRFGNKNWQKF